jgi:hypothetical protein
MVWLSSRLNAMALPPPVEVTRQRVETEVNAPLAAKSQNMPLAWQP